MKAAGVFPAEMSEIDDVYALISRILPENGVNAKIVNLFMAASDEIFSNIVRYGFEGPQDGAFVEVSIQIEDDVVSMTFRDNGKPFDPLSSKGPDISLGLKDRPIGGLGIYLVKNSFDEVCYSYENRFNVFTIKKGKVEELPNA